MFHNFMFFFFSLSNAAPVTPDCLFNLFGLQVLNLIECSASRFFLELFTSTVNIRYPFPIHQLLLTIYDCCHSNSLFQVIYSKTCKNLLAARFPLDSSLNLEWLRKSRWRIYINFLINNAMNTALFSD